MSLDIVTQIGDLLSEELGPQEKLGRIAALIAQHEDPPPAEEDQTAKALLRELHDAEHVTFCTAEAWDRRKRAWQKVREFFNQGA